MMAHSNKNPLPISITLSVRQAGRPILTIMRVASRLIAITQNPFAPNTSENYSGDRLPCTISTIDAIDR